MFIEWHIIWQQNLINVLYHFFKHQNDGGSRPELCGLIQEEITRIKHLAVRGWNIHNLHRFLSHRLLIFGLADLPRCFLQSFLLTFFPWPFVHITVISNNYIIFIRSFQSECFPINLMICYLFYADDLLCCTCPLMTICTEFN